MTNEQLVSRIKAGEDVAGNMEALYLQVRSFIHSIAWRYRGGGELEDLEQEGYLALYDAIDGFDPERGCKFLTYAEPWIRQRMRRYMERNSCLRLSLHGQERQRRYKRLCDAFLKEHNREPSEEEAAACLGLSLDQIGTIKEYAAGAHLVSLDAPVKGLDGGEDTTVGDLLAAPGSLESDVVDKVQAEQLKAALWGCVDALEGRQPAIIRKRYQEGLTLEAVGRQYGVSRDAVRQQEAKALRTLRRPKTSAKLRPYLEDSERYSIAIRGNGVERFNRTWTSSTERAALWLV